MVALFFKVRTRFVFGLGVVVRGGTRVRVKVAVAGKG